MTSKSVLKKQSSSAGVNGRNRLYDILENVTMRRVVLVTLLSISLILATILLVLATISIGTFRLHQLTMVSGNFLSGPIIMIITSAGALALVMSGFFSLHKTHYLLNFANALVSGVLTLLVVVSVVLSFMIRDNIEHNINKVNVDEELGKAVKDVDLMNIWDSLQERYSCCGGLGNSGFHDWEPHLNGSYPDSCCTVSYPGCGRHAHRSLETDFKQTVYERLHVKGCFTAVHEVLERFVSPLFLCWSVLGLLLAPVLLSLCLVSGLSSWYLHKLDTQGARIVPEKTQGDHCPVHGDKKISSASRSEEKIVQNASSTRTHKHSRSRHEH